MSILKVAIKVVSQIRVYIRLFLFSDTTKMLQKFMMVFKILKVLGFRFHGFRVYRPGELWASGQMAMSPQTSLRPKLSTAKSEDPAHESARLNPQPLGRC